MTDSDAAVRDLLDKDAIREQLYTYCRSVDRLDVPLGHGVFHEDSHADYGEGVYQGPGQGCIDHICRSHLQLSSHSHQISNILITLDGDRAGSEAYVTGTMRFERDGTEFQALVRARYIDAWEKRDGRWAITRRELCYDHEDLHESPLPSGLPRTAARDASDPSYAVLSGAAR
jgi:hypothetical protein